MQTNSRNLCNRKGSPTRWHSNCVLKWGPIFKSWRKLSSVESSRTSSGKLQATRPKPLACWEFPRQPCIVDSTVMGSEDNTDNNPNCWSGEPGRCKASSGSNPANPAHNRQRNYWESRNHNNRCDSTSHCSPACAAKCRC